jgi:hypothetical protein
VRRNWNDTVGLLEQPFCFNHKAKWSDGKWTAVVCGSTLMLSSCGNSHLRSSIVMTYAFVFVTYMTHVTLCDRYFVINTGSTIRNNSMGLISNTKLVARFENFTAVTMKDAVFWDVAPRRSYVNGHFGGTYRLHLHGRKIRERGTSVSRCLQVARCRSCVNLHFGGT